MFKDGDYLTSASLSARGQDVRSDASAESVGAIRAPAISLPKGGGAIRGIGEKFAANPVTGTGSITLPIATSPGRSGFGPQLTLSYDSGAGNGPFGFGWSLSLPAITRKTDKGLPLYFDARESDVYLLSGSEDLVPVLQPDGKRFFTTATGYTIHHYRPRIEGLFARIERWQNDKSGEIHWRSITRDNVTTEYGKDNNSRIFDPADPSPDQPSRIFSWLICQSYDDKGNAIIYEYAEENGDRVDHTRSNEKNRTRSANRYLKRIRYGNRVPNRDLDTWEATDPSALSSGTWIFEMVFDYGEGRYAEEEPDAEARIFASAQIDPPAGSRWPVRQDPFSIYRAGFEIRTYHLCRRVLTFHHFPVELGVDDCLVRSTEFSYEETPIASFITSVSQSGFVRQPLPGQPNRYLKKSLPSIEFEYSRVPTAEQLAMQPIRYLEAESLANLPAGLDGAMYQWMDLDGDGTSGVLTEQGDTWYYKRNLSANNQVLENEVEHTVARLGPVKAVARKPASGLSAGAQFLDLAGDGQVDLVEMKGPVRGFYERTDDADWESFRPFISWPNVNTRDPNLRFIDLTGDGHSDILISEGDALTWYPSFAEAGFGQAIRVSLPLDEEKGPRFVFADSVQSVYLADLSGDGLADLVRIRNGEVCYWPNLGYGRFGAKVTMDDAPWFDLPEQFDQRRIRLADTDGSGTTDILYLRRDGVHIYFNQTGNSWSNASVLPQFPAIDDISSVQALDLLGNGTACLVWSSSLPDAARRSLRYVALMEEKPHLLVGIKNNLGAETSIHYAPSTKFFLNDERAGKPWITRLPFPVHVVDRLETHDRVSRNRFVTRYVYHHGYFDGVEREFRGFGMVEQLDTEEFATLSASDVFPDATNIDAASHVPPVLTKTWFHTGAHITGRRISKHFEHEYYHEGDPSLGEDALNDEDIEPMLLPDTVLPTRLTADEEREACRVLKGAILRQEIYALDQKEESDRPYSVSERNYTIKLLQPRGANRHAVFFSHARETIDFQYERKLYAISGQRRADPRVTHNVVLEVDEYGNVLKTVAIGYGRRFDAPDTSLKLTDREMQKKPLLTVTENRYTNAVLDTNAYRAPMLCESRTYELIKITPDANQYGLTNLFRFQELEHKVNAAGDGEHDLLYEDVDATAATTVHPYRRLIEHVRTIYRSNDLTVPLPISRLQSLALPFESYKLAFTPGLVRQVFADRINDSMPAHEGRYVHIEGDDNWWLPSGRSFFSRNPAIPAVAELSEARAHFFLPRRFEDPFGNLTFVDYDVHDLLLMRTEDALRNIVFGENDYRTLAPFRITDPNGNRAEVTFDALGMVVGTAVMGKVDEHKGDLIDDAFISDLDDATLLAHLAAPLVNPHNILRRATTRLVYDLFAYQRSSDAVRPQPTVVYTLTRETHDADLAARQTKIQHSFSYSDGFGREIQKKIQAEPGKVPRRDPGTGSIVVGNGQPEMSTEDVSPRWVGSGWTVFNNKGKPVRQYEPFFTDTHRFEFDRRIGVSPVLFYDPVERVVATLHPNHTWEKVVFDPWQQRTYDVNDNVLVADPRTDPGVGDFFRRLPDAEYLPSWHHARRQSRTLGPHEQAAANKAAVHADTPMVAHFDTLGRTFLTVAHNRFKRSDSTDPPTEEFHHTRVTLDIEGNQREVIDAKDRVVMRYDYDMLGTRIHQASMEAGERWTLNNVAGKPVCAWDSRGHVTRYSYDALQRPTHLFMRSREGAAQLVERLIYGELHPEALALNLRGKLYQHYDGAGVFTQESYDFKGNVLSSNRRLAKEYKQVVDWSALSTLTEIDSVTAVAAPLLESETFSGATSYDALNRPVTITTPDHSVIRSEFNEANLLNAVKANLRGAIEETNFVTNIDYNAKGQRTLIDYGNRVTTTYEYDPRTFRLIHLLTLRDAVVFPDDCPRVPPADWPGCQIQNLHYTYDPVGNITHIRDDAQQTIFFRNQRVEPSADYSYDATYRLTEARGREHLGQTGAALNPPTPPDAWNFFHTGLPQPGDGHAMGNYIEEYNYDQVGNFIDVIHRAIDPLHHRAIGSWRRHYEYQENSLLEPGGAVKSNRLTSTTVTNGETTSESYRHDQHGNMTNMLHLVAMEWDHKDQLHVTQRMVVNGGGTGERTYYVYDSSGQRVRKVTENSAIPGATPTRKEERIYLGRFELYRSYTRDATTFERETLHIMDDQQRVALVETKTKDSDHPPSIPQPVIRYQLGNHLGSASLELDDVGAVISYEEYFPYGSTSYQAVNNAIEVSPKRYRYTGMERDEESGLSYHKARYYAPWLGRWVSCDQLRAENGMNVYHFVASNPINWVDLNGLQASPAMFTEEHESSPRMSADPSVWVSRQPSTLMSVDPSVWVSEQSSPPVSVDPDTRSIPPATSMTRSDPTRPQDSYVYVRPTDIFPSGAEDAAGQSDPSLHQITSLPPHVAATRWGLDTVPPWFPSVEEIDARISNQNLHQDGTPGVVVSQTMFGLVDWYSVAYPDGTILPLTETGGASIGIGGEGVLANGVGFQGGFNVQVSERGIEVYVCAGPVVGFEESLGAGPNVALGQGGSGWYLTAGGGVGNVGGSVSVSPELLVDDEGYVGGGPSWGLGSGVHVGIVYCVNMTDDD
jgi:RHS repeat-associated protein